MELFRIHSDDFEPAAFNPTDPDSPVAYGGGRFDTIAGAPAFLYAGRSVEAAVAEGLLRDVPFDDAGYLILPRKKLQGRMLSRVSLRWPVDVVCLHGSGLHAVGQDTWLVRCDPCDYPVTRLWAQALREWVPRAAGFEWRARHDDDVFAYVFYEDRTGGAIEPCWSASIDQGEGFERVVSALVHYSVVLDRP